METKYINVNDLCLILEKHFNYDRVMIEDAVIGSSSQQHAPKRFNLGIGAVLNIKFSYTKEKHNARTK